MLSTLPPPKNEVYRRPRFGALRRFRHQQRQLLHPTNLAEETLNNGEQHSAWFVSTVGLKLKNNTGTGYK